MKYSKIKLIREQTSEKLKKFNPLAEINMPFRGWIRSIRQSLGMNTRQLAERIDVKRQRVSEIEKEEVKGNLTVETLRKTAEAMGCKFVYALIPATTLENIVRRQAELVVEKRMKRVSHSMALEKQELSLKEKQKAVDDAVEKILHDDPGSIWDDKS
ncbi:MAG: mobile mystery protein A [Elusimicrobia bacterium]|jgi:predicted DNA-binding mobile mystery protein A|nr:mobile mystery protein A [Elusimicrobiota bacterium]